MLHQGRFSTFSTHRVEFRFATSHGRFPTPSKYISSWGSRLHRDVKAGVNLYHGVAPWAILNVFDIYVELRFATSQGCEGWGQFISRCCARDGYTNLENIDEQALPDGYSNLEKLENQTISHGYADQECIRDSVRVIWIYRVECVDQ